VGKKDWRIEPINAIPKQKLIRTIAFDGTTQAELMEYLTPHTHDSLRSSEARQGLVLPWWEFLVFKNISSKGGPSAVLFRIEHCMGDGMALAKLFEGLITKESGDPVGALLPSNKQTAGNKQQRPSRLKSFFQSFPAFGKVLSLPTSKFDHDTAFSKSRKKSMVYSGNRRIVVFPTAPLSFIKDLKNAQQVTVNDILLTALSMAISRYNDYQGCNMKDRKGEKLRCRALLPVALPRPSADMEDKSKALSNKWVFVSVKLGTGIDNNVERLKFVHSEMNKIKKSPLVFVQHSVQETISPKMGLKLARKTVYDTFARHSLIFSNVPGPQYPCKIAGKTAFGCQMVFNNLLPQVGILSYNGGVFMNIVLDPLECPQCDKLGEFYRDSLISLAQEFGVTVPTDF